MRKPCAAAVLLSICLAPLGVAGSPANPPAPAASQAEPADQSTSAVQVSPAEPAAVPPDQQATREQLTKLFEVMRLRQQMNMQLGMVSSAMQQSMRQGFRQAMAQVPNADRLTSGQQAKLEDIMSGYMKKAVSVYPAEEAIEDAAAVYQRHMSRSDVDAYIAFYGSPAGQHLLDAQPVIMKEFMPIILKKVEDRSKALQSGLMQDIANFVKAQTPQSAPPVGK